MKETSLLVLGSELSTSNFLNGRCKTLHSGSTHPPLAPCTALPLPALCKPKQGGTWCCNRAHTHTRVNAHTCTHGRGRTHLSADPQGLPRTQEANEAKGSPRACTPARLAHLYRHALSPYALHAGMQAHQTRAALSPVYAPCWHTRPGTRQGQPASIKSTQAQACTETQEHSPLALNPHWDPGALTVGTQSALRPRSTHRWHSIHGPVSLHAASHMTQCRHTHGEQPADCERAPSECTSWGTAQDPGAQNRAVLSLHSRSPRVQTRFPRQHVSRAGWVLIAEIAAVIWIPRPGCRQRFGERQPAKTAAHPPCPGC